MHSWELLCRHQLSAVLRFARLERAKSHGAHAGTEAVERNHCNVNDDEKNEAEGEKEMNGACRLTSAQKRGRCRERSSESGRHGEPGPNHQREQDEDDNEIAGTLQDIVGVEFIGGGARMAKVSADVGHASAERALLTRGEQVAAEMTAGEEIEEVDDAGDDEKPRRFEMQVAAPAILVREDITVTGRDTVARGGDVKAEEWRRVDVTDLTPVEARMRNQNLNTGDEQRDGRDEGKPVRDANEQRMPHGCGIRNLGGGRHAARIARVVGDDVAECPTKDWRS